MPLSLVRHLREEAGVLDNLFELYSILTISENCVEL